MAASLPSGSRPTDAERLARLTLNLVAEPGDAQLAGMAARVGPERLLAELRAPGAVEAGSNLADRLARVRPEQTLERAAGAGIRFVIPGDPEWPAGLDDLRRAPTLYERGGPPIGLWVRGEHRVDELVSGSVAVVGSRSSTMYGEEMAGRIAAEVADAGPCVVSGAALGVDQAAHRGALAMRGKTVAVLPCGLDRIYPASHRALVEHIVDTAAIVSEVPPGGAPTRVRFLARNRMIAALSVGTVVVEAALRSGALNTANWAAGMDRLLMGVPGPVTSEPSSGVHQMIRNRDAVLVTGGDEVLELISESGQYTLEFKRALPSSRRDLLDVESRQVLDAVPLINPADAASVAHTAGLRVTRVREVLLRLHEMRLVECLDGAWRVAAGARPPGPGQAGVSP